MNNNKQILIDEKAELLDKQQHFLCIINILTECNSNGIDDKAIEKYKTDLEEVNSKLKNIDKLLYEDEN